MTKNYKFLKKATMLLLSFLAVPFGMLGQAKITDYSNIVSGTQYYIGATTGGNDYYLSVNGSAIMNSIAGTAVTSMDDATPFTFEGSDASWTIQFESGYYLSLKDGKDNGKVQVVEDAVTFTASNQSSKLRLSKGNYSIQKNNSGTQFGSYGNTQTDIWLMEVPVGLVATTTTIDASGITNTDVYTGTAAGSLTATVTETESGNAVSGATVTWTSSKENVATIDKDGVVTLVAAGTTTITASYEGVSGEFGASSATYELTVTSSAPYEQPTEFEIGLNNALFGTTYGGSVSGITDENPIVGTQDNVTVTYAGGGNHYVNDNQIRFYPSNKLTFEAPEGYEIKEIVFTSAGTWAATISADGGTYDSNSKTWTGSATSVLFTGSGSSRCDMSKASITLGLPSSDPIISANNVNIAYDATSGEIAYTITNPVTDKTLQATADVDWVSDITVGDEAITFTTTANEANTERVATFTLTYEGAEDKNVTVTQAGDPNFTTIPALFAAATSTATNVMVEFGGWVVSGVSTNGKNVFVTDNNGNGFVIYSSSSLAATYAVGNTLTGTTECSLKLNQGYAQLQNVDATELTIEDGGTVTEQDIALANLAGVNTGALVSYEELTCSIDDSGNTPKYYLSDGTTTLQVYNSLYADAYTTLEAGKTYDITGVYQQYGNTKEILPRSAADIEEDLSASIVVANANVQVEGTGGSGLLTVTYTGVNGYYANVQWYDQNGDPANSAPLWLNAGLDENYDLTYMVGPNDGEARSAYLKIYVETEGVYSNLVTITQAKYVPDYASLPFQYTDDDVLEDGLDGMPNGLTQNGLGTYTNANTTPRLKFDGTGDNLVLKINPDPEYQYAPHAITFDIKGNNFSGGTFAVQVSEDGETYTDLATYTDSEITSSNQTITLLNTNDNVKYIKWIYTEKVQGGGNIGIGNIYVDDEYLVRGNATVSEDLTLAACEIESEGKLTIESGATFEVTEPYALYNGGNRTNLVIKDGGQLKTPNEVFATVEKEIIGYTQDNYYTNKGYYLVSAPAEKYLYVASENADVDAYMFDASEEGEEWRNFKGAQGAWNISASSAILYATKENSTLSLDGQGVVYNQANQGANEVANKVPATTTNIDIDIRFNSGKAFEGYNLIGNPFTCTAYLADGRDFLRMNEARDGFVWTSGAIGVCEGIFVVAESSSDNKVTFTTTNPTDGNAGPAALTLNLTQSRGNVIDNARIRFGEGRNFAKFALNESNARVSFTQGNKEYSLVRSNGQGEMPVSFKAAQNGTYTISINAENIEMDYMHLIDNMTGADIDLLAVPSYTFTARTTDYASRFRLVFSANNVNENAENDTFAYFNGSEWVINGSDNATVQVIDMMGRVVLSGTNTIATNDMQAGVYVIRLVDGNNVKTQKIVVQ